MQARLITTGVMRECASGQMLITQEGKLHSRLTVLQYHRRDVTSITKFPQCLRGNTRNTRPETAATGDLSAHPYP